MRVCVCVCVCVCVRTFMFCGEMNFLWLSSATASILDYNLKTNFMETLSLRDTCLLNPTSSMFTHFAVANLSNCVPLTLAHQSALFTQQCMTGGRVCHTCAFHKLHSREPCPLNCSRDSIEAERHHPTKLRLKPELLRSSSYVLCRRWQASLCRPNLKP